MPRELQALGRHDDRLAGAAYFHRTPARRHDRGLARERASQSNGARCWRKQRTHGSKFDRALTLLRSHQLSSWPHRQQSAQRRNHLKRSESRLIATTAERSALLSRVRQKGTAPETVVQQILTDLGHEYLKNVRGIPGSPDIVAADQSRAVFVHGCYWHRHLDCPASSTPKQNAKFWREKFAMNVRRDRRKARELRELGYSVMTIWECQTKTAEKRVRLTGRLNRFFLVDAR